MNTIENPETTKAPEATVTSTEFTINLRRFSWTRKDDRVNRMLDSQVHNMLGHFENTLKNASAGSLAFWKEIFVLCDQGTCLGYEPWEIFPFLRGCMQMIEEGTLMPDSVDEVVDADEQAA